MTSQEPFPSVVTNAVPRPAPHGMGNGLFATKDIQIGQDVVHAKVPFVAVLDSPRLDDTCAGCFGKRQMETGTDLKACTGCRVVRYCDRVCTMFSLFFFLFSFTQSFDFFSSSFFPLNWKVKRSSEGFFRGENPMFSMAQVSLSTVLGSPVFAALQIQFDNLSF